MTEGQVFAVSYGEYSSYGIECVFEDEEDAYAYAAARNGLTAEEMHFTEDRDNLWRSEFADPWKNDRYREIVQKATGPEWFRVERFQFYPAGVVPALKGEESNAS